MAGYGALCTYAVRKPSGGTESDNWALKAAEIAGASMTEDTAHLLSLRVGSDSTLEEEAEIIAAMAEARGIHFTSEELLEDYRRRAEERERARKAADVQELSDELEKVAGGGQICKIGKVYHCSANRHPYQDAHGTRQCSY